MLSASGILLVDDDVEDHTIIAEALQLVDNTRPLYFEKNCAEALVRLAEWCLSGEMPCLLVLDLNMPRMGGTEMLGILKEDPRFKHIPVVIYSTSINKIEKEACLKLGAIAYVTKPLSFTESIEVAKLFLALCNPLIASGN